MNGRAAWVTDLAPGLRWFVATIACDHGERRERHAGRALAQDGVPVYCPTLTDIRIDRWKKRWLTQGPLFPGYIFAAFNPGRLPDMSRWARHGLDGLLMRAGQAGVPAEVPAGAVADILEAEIGDQLVVVRAPRPKSPRKATEDALGKLELAPGMMLRMKPDGRAFSTLAAELVAAEPNMRIKVLFDLLGRKVPAHVDLADIEPGT